MPEAEAGPACPVPLGPALGRVWSGPCLVGALPSLGALCSPALPPPVGDLRDFVRSHLGNPELPFYLCEFAYSLPLPPPRAFPQNTCRLLRPRPRGGHGGPNPAPMPVHPLLLAWPPGPRSWGDTSPPRRASRWRRLGPTGSCASGRPPRQRFRGCREVAGAVGRGVFRASQLWPGLPLCLRACLSRECGQGARRGTERRGVGCGVRDRDAFSPQSSLLPKPSWRTTR